MSRARYFDGAPILARAGGAAFRYPRPLSPLTRGLEASPGSNTNVGPPVNQTNLPIIMVPPREFESLMRRVETHFVMTSSVEGALNGPAAPARVAFSQLRDLPLHSR